MLSKKFCALALSLLLLAACAPGEPAQSPAPSPSSQSGAGEEAPEPAPEEEPAPASSSEEAPPEEEAPASSAPSEPAPEPSSKVEPAPGELTWEEMTDEERRTLDQTRQALTSYLEEALGPEGYTYFYYTDDQLGLGIAAPDLEAAREAVEAYDGPQMRVEYLETVHSRAELDAAYEDYRAMADPQRDTDEEIVANISSGGEQGGYIVITVHQMYPALEEYLETSEYRDCFQVEVTGADSPIVNPDA